MIGIAARPISSGLPRADAERAALRALFGDEQSASNREELRTAHIGRVSKANRIEQVIGQRERLG